MLIIPQNVQINQKKKKYFGQKIPQNLEKYVIMLVRSLYTQKCQNKPKYVKKKKIWAENPPKLGEKIKKYVIIPKKFKKYIIMLVRSLYPPKKSK